MNPFKLQRAGRWLPLLVMIFFLTPLAASAQYVAVPVLVGPPNPTPAGITSLKALTGSTTSDRVNWGTLGGAPIAVSTNLPSGSTVGSEGGFGVRVTNASPGIEPNLQRDIIGSTFPTANSSFGPGEGSLYNSPVNNGIPQGGPTTFTFGTNVIGAGARIDPGGTDTFNVTLEALDRNGLVLGMVTYTGLNNDLGTGNAPFVGIAGPAFAAVRFNVSGGSGNILPGTYAISDLIFVVPEPSSIALFTLGLVGTFGYQIRRRRNQS